MAEKTTAEVNRRQKRTWKRHTGPKQNMETPIQEIRRHKPQWFGHVKREDSSKLL